jgi:hypothetical protein
MDALPGRHVRAISAARDDDRGAGRSPARKTTTPGEPAAPSPN